MTLSQLPQRDRRALALLGVCVLVFSGVYFWPSGSAATVDVSNSIPLEEKRLSKLRRAAASAPARDELLKKVEDELARREKGLIVADTAPLAQAQLSQIVRRVAQAQQPAIVFKATEFTAPRAFGDAYGEVQMAVSLECGIEQIVNFLSDMSNQPELVSVTEIQFGQVAGKLKLVPARIAFSGIVPRRLVPEKKGAAAF